MCECAALDVLPKALLDRVRQVLTLATLYGAGAVWKAFRWWNAPAHSAGSGLSRPWLGVRWMAARRSERGYLGLLFTDCLFLFGFCLRGLNSVTKTSHRGKDREKELMFKGLKFAVVAFASKGLSPPPPFFPFSSLGF